MLAVRDAASSAASVDSQQEGKIADRNAGNKILISKKSVDAAKFPRNVGFGIT